MYFCGRCCAERPSPFCESCISKGRYAPQLPRIGQTPRNPMPANDNPRFAWYVNGVQQVDQYGQSFEPRRPPPFGHRLPYDRPSAQGGWF
jgi:hypothetical protein